MEENKEVKHKHSIDLGDNLTYVLCVALTVAGIILYQIYGK